MMPCFSSETFLRKSIIINFDLLHEYVIDVKNLMKSAAYEYETLPGQTMEEIDYWLLSTTSQSDILYS